jgi:hypothetical protein
MPVRITKTGTPLASVKLATQALMREVGLLARERIIRRTIAGRDQHDDSFQPYSASYAAVKAKELGAAGVNLQVSGQMLNAIVITKLTDNSGSSAHYVAFST